MHIHCLITPNRFAVALVVTAALTVAGCGAGGGSGAGEGTTTGGDSALFAMSRCMRTHGVPNFPDPTKSSGGEGLSVVMTRGSSTVTVGGIGFSGPAFTAAEKTCRFGAYGSRPKLTEGQKQGMLRSAECMRTHGVPNFPDPTFPPGAGVSVAGESQINRNSPTFQSAAKTCQHVGVGIPGGG
ncbi:MAG TPA: hypothetical protein VGL69_16050 [Solirubrobacteraceae bacterium]|jgi:hypothetical protein